MDLILDSADGFCLNHTSNLNRETDSDMPTRARVAELRLDLAVEASELVRAFIREASLAEGAPLATAGHIADGTVIVWRELYRHHGAGQHARLAVLLRGKEIIVRVSVTGHDKFVPFMASLFSGLPADLGFSYRESGIDGWQITLHTSLEPLPPHLPALDEDDEEMGSAEVFQVEPPREEDALAIARCFLQVYGRHYIHPEVFSPRRYWSKVQGGEIIPVIARNALGEVVGHVALEREAGAQIAERGQAVVLPSCRGRHLLEKMTERLTQQAKQIGLVGIFAQPVTIHTFSQRNDDRAGMPICAAMLGIRPENALPKDIPAPTRGQRQSLLLAFRFLDAPGERLIYAPPAYREMIAQISGSLGVMPRFSSDFGAVAKNSSIQVRLDKQGSAHITIDKIGAEIGTELKLTFTNLISLGAEYIQLSAPLSDPGMSLLVDVARALGFFFCGIGPAFFNTGDALLLQFTAHPVDVSKLQLFADQTRALVGFIDKDCRGVAGASHLASLPR